MSPFHSTNQLHKELDILKVKDDYKSWVLRFVFSVFKPYYIGYV